MFETLHYFTFPLPLDLVDTRQAGAGRGAWREAELSWDWDAELALESDPSILRTEPECNIIINSEKTTY